MSLAKRNDRQEKWEKDYVVKIDFLRELSKTRAEFIKTLQGKKQKKVSGDPAAIPSEGDTGGGGGGGTMPTADNYNGPANGAHGQKNLKERIRGTDRWNDMIQQVCTEKGGVNPVFAKCIMAIESGGEPTILSSAGYYGLMQVKASEYGFDPVRLKTDHKYQIECGVEELITKYKTYYLRWKQNSPGKFKGAPETHNWELYQVSWFYYTYGGPQTETYAKQLKEMYEGLGFKISDPFMMSLSGGGGNKSNSKGSALSGDKITPATGDRKGYISKRRSEGKATNWAGWQQLDMNLYTLAHDGVVNRIAPEATGAFNALAKNLIAKTGKSKISCTSAFRANAPDGVQNSPHMAGLALDLVADNIKQAVLFADVAYSMGYRSIAIWGSMNGPAYIHVDVAPYGQWQYDNWPIYTGPDSWKQYR